MKRLLIQLNSGVGINCFAWQYGFTAFLDNYGVISRRDKQMSCIWIKEKQIKLLQF